MSVTIEIDNPEEALLLIDGLTANSHAEFQMKTDILAKIHRAILVNQFMPVWRTIEGFPKYEINGGGLIRFKKYREYLSISHTDGDPIMVHLDDEDGLSRIVFWHDVYMKAFPELEK
ncbi:hypothetical protein SEA_UZUMAKI_82 [Arthrobacter phage Uzumaki]|nr:hypothetical protein SEA_UZUMAKI_82 [Arthrobacter phage Uzumaki]